MAYQEQDTMSTTTHIRFLVTNAEAGVVIGKGGSTINDIQSQSGALIHLSRNGEFFPGTTERIVTVSGAFNDTLKAVDLILSKLIDEFSGQFVDGASDDVELTSSLRVVVPSSSCGGLIGKGGATIRSFMEESRAEIRVSPQDNTSHRRDSRLVIIDGTIDEQVLAIDLILSKLAEDPHYTRSFNPPSPYAEVGYNRPNFDTNGVGRKFETNKVNQDSSTVFVLDKYVGHLVGRGGRNIKEISEATGARIKISNRDDFMLPISERTVTITGSEQALRDAEDMILDKITSAQILVDGEDYEHETDFY